MLPKAEDLLVIVGQKIDADKLKKLEQLTSIVKNVLSNIYDYPKTLKYSKLMTRSELLKYMDEFEIIHSEYHNIKDDIVKSINTNTYLYAYHNISGVIISWHPDRVNNKKDSDIHSAYVLSLDMRIGIEELQEMSKYEINKQKEKELSYFELYINDIINIKIHEATMDGKAECFIYGEDIENYVDLKELSETRYGEVVLGEIASYIETETEYFMALEDIKIQGNDYWRNKLDYKTDKKLTIKWDMESLNSKKDKNPYEVKYDLSQSNKRMTWVSRIFKFFK